MYVKSKPAYSNKWVLLFLYIGMSLLAFLPTVVLYLLDVTFDSMFYLMFYCFYYLVFVVSLTIVFYRQIRQVEIDGTKLHVNFWFFPKWGYTLNLRDFDAYLKEHCPVTDRYGSIIKLYNRIYLRKGNQLWLYTEERVCRNFNELESVLQDEMKLSGTFETIHMSPKEKYSVWRGRPIDIS